MGKTKNWWKVAIAIGLALVLVRALELRLPGITAHMNEDEIHHNYWLLEYNSVFGDYIIWQLQPLLEYQFRLYFWFPLLSLSQQTWGLIVLFVLPLVAGLWLITKRTKADKKQNSRQVWQLYFAFSSWAALWGLGLLWLRLSGSMSTRSVILILFSLLVVLFFSILAYQTWFKTKTIDRLSKKFLSPRFLSIAFVSAHLVFLSCSAALFAWHYQSSLISPAVGTYLGILAPLLIELSLLSLLAVMAIVIARRPNQGAIWLSYLGLVTVFWLAFMLKPLAQHSNYTEWVLKFPNLFFGLATVLVGFYLACRYLGSKRYSQWAVVVIAMLAALWIVSNPLAIQMSVTARHYAFTIFASLLWFWYFVVHGNIRSARFWLVSFLFLNAHFFAILPVLAAYGYGAARSFLQRDFRDGAQHLGLGVSVVAGALIANYSVAYYILTIGSNVNAAQLLANLGQGVAVIEGYLRVLSIPVVALGGWGAVVLFALLVFPLKEPVQKRLAFIGAALVPIFFYYASQPNYSFPDRYYGPFLGFGFVLLVLALERGYLMLGKSGQLKNIAFRRASAAILVLGVLPFAVVTAADLAVGFFRDLPNLDPPLANNSPFYRTYSEMKNQSNRMLIFFYSPIAVRRDIPNFYLDYVGGYDGRYELLNASTSPELARQSTEFFIENYPNHVVILDGLIDSSCPDELAQGPWGASVQRLLQTEGCVWVIRGLNSFDEMCEIANALDFPPSEGESMCTEF